MLYYSPRKDSSAPRARPLSPPKDTAYAPRLLKLNSCIETPSRKPDDVRHDAHCASFVLE
jgi:hypothetical protein